MSVHTPFRATWRGNQGTTIVVFAVVVAPHWVDGKHVGNAPFFVGYYEDDTKNCITVPVGQTDFGEFLPQCVMCGAAKNEEA